MGTYKVTDADVLRFNLDGFLVVERLFDAEEMDLLLKIARADHARASEARGRLDAEGGVSKLALRNTLQEDTYSAIVRSRRVADTMDALLGDEVYHYHHKMSMKEPYTGGAWEWHQDYGYWYNNGCLFPDMASCMIAVDGATRENGCLQVIQGSHRLGRVDHGKAGEQTGADPERVNAALERLPLVHVELQPGSGVFFHSNLLHRSDQNRSSRPRWTLICCYNTRGNDPYKDIPGGHPRYEPLERWENYRVKEIGLRQWSSMVR